MSTKSVKHSRFAAVRLSHDEPWIVIDREIPRYVGSVCDSTRQHVATFATAAAAKRHAADLNRMQAEQP